MEIALLQVSQYKEKKLHFITAATTVIKNTEDLPLDILLKIQ